MKQIKLVFIITLAVVFLIMIFALHIKEKLTDEEKSTKKSYILSWIITITYYACVVLIVINSIMILLFPS